MAMVNLNIKEEPTDNLQTLTKGLVKNEPSDCLAKLLISSCECCKAPIDPRWAELQAESIKAEPPSPEPHKSKVDHVEREGKSLRLKRSLSVDENRNPPKRPTFMYSEMGIKSNSFSTRRSHYWKKRRPKHHWHNFHYTNNLHHNQPQFSYFGNVSRNWAPYWKLQNRFYQKKMQNRNFIKLKSKPEKEIILLRMTSAAHSQTTIMKDCASETQIGSPESQMEFDTTAKENTEAVSSPSTFSDKENQSYPGHCNEDSQNEFHYTENDPDTVSFSVIEGESSSESTVNGSTGILPLSFKSIIGINNEEFLILDETEENSNQCKPEENSECQREPEPLTFACTNLLKEIDSSSENDIRIGNISNEKGTKGNSSSPQNNRPINSSQSLEINSQCLEDLNKSLRTSTENSRELDITSENEDIEVVKEVPSNGEIECVVNKCKEAHLCVKCFIRKKKTKRDKDVICLGKINSHSCKDSVPVITLRDTED